MWQRYLQYYLWRLLPKFFKQPIVVRMKRRTIRASRLVSVSYNLEFEKYATIDHFIGYLKERGFTVIVGFCQERVDPIEHRLYLAQDIVLNKQLTADVLMPYFEANPWSDLKIRIGDKLIEDGIISNEAVLVPWAPEKKA